MHVCLQCCSFLVRAELPNGLSFTAYTYAGELPSCAFGFNSNGLVCVFTYSPRGCDLIASFHGFSLWFLMFSSGFYTKFSASVQRRNRRRGCRSEFRIERSPRSNWPCWCSECMRNSVPVNYWKLLERMFNSNSIVFSLQRIRSPNVSVGHCYNLVDVRNRRILNVETTSQNRFSVREVGATPFFHANMYLHLQVKQVLNCREEHLVSGTHRVDNLTRSRGVKLSKWFHAASLNKATRWELHLPTTTSGFTFRRVERRGIANSWRCCRWEISNLHDRWSVKSITQ